MMEKIITCKTCGEDIPEEHVLEAASKECRKCTTRAVSGFVKGFVKVHPVTFAAVPVPRQFAHSIKDLLEENRALKRMVVQLCRKIKALQGQGTGTNRKGGEKQP